MRAKNLVAILYTVEQTSFVGRCTHTDLAVVCRMCCIDVCAMLLASALMAALVCVEYAVTRIYSEWTAAVCRTSGLSKIH
jgi:ABC-type uncharacterized transport system YnjBCD permease subunit